jgi:hypothetical protein
VEVRPKEEATGAGEGTCGEARPRLFTEFETGISTSALEARGADG